MALDTSLDSLTPDTKEAVEGLLAALKAKGIEAKIRSTRRSCQEQAELYSIGRGDGDTRAIVTKAKGCMSWHTLGRAVDITLLGGASYDVLGQTAIDLGFVWGGNFTGFPDVGHVEWHPGVKIEQICTNPDQCEAGVEASMAFLPTGGGGLGGMSAPLAFLACVAVGYLGARWALSTSR
jgi:hypothetical protein